MHTQPVTVCRSLQKEGLGRGWSMDLHLGTSKRLVLNECLRKLSAWFEVEGLKDLGSTSLRGRQAVLRGLWLVWEHTAWRG